jgi:hypothetical protein
VKYLSLLLILFVCFAACKKKSSGPATTMTVLIEGDTAWTTNTLVTTNQNDGTVYITAINKAANEQLALAMSSFVEGTKSYHIDYRGTGGNIYGNTGSYTQGSNIYDGRTGYINVTAVTNNTIIGSFAFSTDKGNVTGNFTAAEH